MALSQFQIAVNIKELDLGSVLFSADSPIKKWCFFPSAWGGNGYWLDGWDGNEKEAILSHLKICVLCRELEISTMLQYAARPFRTMHNETIYLDPVKHHEAAFNQTVSFYKSLSILIDRIIALLTKEELLMFVNSSLPVYIIQKIRNRLLTEGICHAE